MGVLDLNLNDVKEPTTVEAGEYKLVLHKATLKDTAAGDKQYILAVMGIEEEPDAKGIFHNMMIPYKGGEEYANSFKLSIKRFCEAFKLPVKLNFDKDNNLVGAKGKKAWAIVKETHDEEYGDKNEISRFIRPA